MICKACQAFFDNKNDGEMYFCYKCFAILEQDYQELFGDIPYEKVISASFDIEVMIHKMEQWRNKLSQWTIDYDAQAEHICFEQSQIPQSV